MEFEAIKWLGFGGESIREKKALEKEPHENLPTLETTNILLRN